MLRNKRSLALNATAFVCASVSILALLIHAVGFLPMYFLIYVLGPPSLILLLLLGIVGYRINEKIFFNRLAVGAWGGIVATLGYDLIRLVLWKISIFSYDPFLSHPLFGKLITGFPENATLSILVGWAYHFWNGFGFGIMYTLIAGPAGWYYALAWALFLEIGWLTALPSVLKFQLNFELIMVSLIGHGAYGVILGMLSQRFIKH